MCVETPTVLAALALVLSPFDSRLDALLDAPSLRGSVVAAVVADEAGQVLYERNADLRVVPGSNQKLLTVSFALHTLGPDAAVDTRIWKRPGRVIVDAPGDPSLTSGQLSEAARRMGLSGRDRVEVRNAYRPLIPPSWEWDDLPNRYAAPIAAFSVDRGAFELWAERGRLQFVPRPYGVRVRWGARTGVPKVAYDPIRRELLVSGLMPQVRTRLDTLAVAEPDRAAADWLGGPFAMTDQVPTTAPTAVIRGRTIAEQAKHCLTNSDNHYAEHLLLMATRKVGPVDGPIYLAASQRLARFVQETVGTGPQSVLPVDGSGMSRHNLVTARSLVTLLVWQLRQPTRALWLEALARPGTGTLAERLKGVRFEGKTGTLNRTAALSGYVTDARGERRIVSVVLNNFAGTTAEARAVVDGFVAAVAEGASAGTNRAGSSSR